MRSTLRRADRLLQWLRNVEEVESAAEAQEPRAGLVGCRAHESPPRVPPIKYPLLKSSLSILSETSLGKRLVHPIGSLLP